jgi:predicted nucleic acid-binding protein
MSAEHFIDTNLLIYELEASDECKSAIADHIIRTFLDRDVEKGCVMKVSLFPIQNSLFINTGII